MLKLKILVLINFTFLLQAYPQERESFTIPNKNSQAVSLSDLSSDCHFIILKASSKNELFHINHVAFLEDKILALDSNSPDHVFPKRLNLFNKNGEHLRNLGYATAIGIDEENNHFYALGPMGLINKYSKDGELLKMIQLETSVQDIHFFNSKIYFSRSETLADGIWKYSLHAVDPNTEKVELIHEFRNQNPKENEYSKIGAHCRMWSNNVLFWTFGLEDHFYQINKKGEVTSVPVSFEFERPYFSQVLTSYGTFNDYFLCSYTINMNRKIVLENLLNNTVSVINPFINDDIYQTGEFIMTSYFYNKMLYFVKNAEDLSGEILKKFSMTTNDKLLIFANPTES